MRPAKQHHIKDSHAPPSGGMKGVNGLDNGLAVLHVWEMSRPRNHHAVSLRQRGSPQRGVRWCQEGVLLAPDDKRRGRQKMQVMAQAATVEVGVKHQADTRVSVIDEGVGPVTQFRNIQRGLLQSCVRKKIARQARRVRIEEIGHLGPVLHQAERADQNQPGNPLRSEQGEFSPYPSPEARADNNRPLERQPIKELQQQHRQVVRRLRPLRQCGLPIARQVGNKHLETFGQPLVIVHPARLAPQPVEPYQRRPLAGLMVAKLNSGPRCSIPTQFKRFLLRSHTHGFPLL